MSPRRMYPQGVPSRKTTISCFSRQSASFDISLFQLFNFQFCLCLRGGCTLKGYPLEKQHLVVFLGRVPTSTFHYFNYSIFSFILLPPWRNWIFVIRLADYVRLACSISNVTFSHLLNGVLLRHFTISIIQFSVGWAFSPTNFPDTEYRLILQIIQRIIICVQFYTFFE